MLAALFARLTRALVRGLVRLYYPRIEIEGRERVPASGPVLLTANHANSILDPPVLGICVGRPVNFLAKAPLFDVPLLGSAIEAAGMIPAFRSQDDAAQVSRNFDSLHAAAQRLAGGAVVGIFPEGKSHDLLHVETVKSGAARIALDALAQGAPGLQVVPIGINYERKEGLWTAIWIRVAEPIDPAALLAAEQGDEARARRALTREIDRRLKEVVIHLDDPALATELEDLEVFLPAPKRRHPEPAGAIRQRKRIADAMNYFLAKEPDRAAAMAHELRVYRAALAEAGIEPRSPVMRYRRLRLFGHLLRQLHWLTLGSIPAAAGVLHHFFPVLILNRLVNRFSGKIRSTVALSRLAVGVPLMVAWYVGVWFALRSYFLPWVAWTWTLCMPFAGALALVHFRRLSSNLRRWWSQMRLVADTARLRRLRVQQAEVREKLAAFAADYARVHPVEASPEAPRNWRRIAWVTSRWILIGAGVAGVWTAVHWWLASREDPVRPPVGLDLAAVSPAGLEAGLERDEALLQQLITEVEEFLGRAQQFQSDLKAGRRTWYRQIDNDAARALLLGHLNQRSALLRLLWKYADPDRISEERLRERGFLIGFAAASVLYDASLRFVAWFDGEAEARRKFNEAEPLWDVPAGVFDSLRRQLVLPELRDRLSAARARYERDQSLIDRLGLRAAPRDRFHTAITRCQQAINDHTATLLRAQVEAPAKAAARASQGVAYGIQTFVSTWLGDTKVREPRAGHGLITPDLVEKLRPQLQPGDVLIERRNWYLSNAFLPGYWPHAALYLGPPAGLEKLGLRADARVQAHWDAYLRADATGHVPEVIESVSEGVVFTSLEHSVGEADAIAVLRPRLPPERIREALGRAFSHAGKPYDFEFDFFSTDKLVCTELVFRAYDGDIQFPLVDVMGTRTMPAMELVRKFVEERTRPTAAFQFVAFVDSDEWRGRAFFSTEEAFARTLKRPKAEWLQGLGLENR